MFRLHVYVAVCGFTYISFFIDEYHFSFAFIVVSFCVWMKGFQGGSMDFRDGFNFVMIKAKPLMPASSLFVLVSSADAHPFWSIWCGFVSVNLLYFA